MTSAAFVKNDTDTGTTGTEPGTTGTPPDAALPERLQLCADILAEARARRIRAEQAP